MSFQRAVITDHHNRVTKCGSVTKCASYPNVAETRREQMLLTKWCRQTWSMQVCHKLSICENMQQLRSAVRRGRCDSNRIVMKTALLWRTESKREKECKARLPKPGNSLTPAKETMLSGWRTSCQMPTGTGYFVPLQ